MEFASARGEQRYAALVRAAANTVVGLDFDGTLAPIVEDPTRAHVHPDAPTVLLELAMQVSAVAVITGRPARQALELGLAEVGDRVAAEGKELFLFGQYGNERWSSSRRRVIGPRPPAGLATFERELPRLLRRLDATEAYVEDKGLAVAVHTRRLDDGEQVYGRLLPELTELAGRHDLVVEPGRRVIEVRSGGMHKGLAVRALVEERRARGFLYAGDDLGDVEAFDAVRALEDAEPGTQPRAEPGSQGLATLLVCASPEQETLRDRADVVTDGPEGVLALLAELTRDAAGLRA